MRRGATLATAAALLVAGCGLGGDGEAERPARPAAAAPAATPAATPTPTPGPSVAGEVAAQLDAGTVGVVDAERRALVAPARMRPNKDQTLSGLAWDGWGGRTAVGRGTVETLVCDPSCAQGTVEESEATLTLSAPRVCGGRRFYSRAELEYLDSEAGRRREAAVYLLTPC